MLKKPFLEIFYIPLPGNLPYNNIHITPLSQVERSLEVWCMGVQKRQIFVLDGMFKCRFYTILSNNAKTFMFFGKKLWKSLAGMDSFPTFASAFGLRPIGETRNRSLRGLHEDREVVQEAVPFSFFGG